MSSSLGGRILRSATSRRRRKAVWIALRAGWPLLPRIPAPRQPIFVLGSPRSGTTMLFSVLSASPAVAALPGEAHLLWNLFHDEGRPGWTSQATPPEAIARGEPRALNWMIRQIAGGLRYLDKTPRNSLQVPYLHALFPDAHFVFLVRDGRATVSSLLNGWRDQTGMFPGRRLSVELDIDGYDAQQWKFVAPPGWRAYATRHTLAEVCAFQWTATMNAVLAGKRLIRPERWTEVRYEDVVAEPEVRIAELLRALNLPEEQRVLERARRLDATVTKAQSAPRPEKWREENPDEVASVLPMIAPVMDELGYRV